MHWLRSKTDRFVWLALFALACELVLSFGHVHLGKNAGNVWTAAFGAASTADAGPINQTTPAKGPVSTTDDFCAICANINLVGTSALPILASILAPVSRLISLPAPRTEIRPRAIATLAFRARGPPPASD